MANSGLQLSTTAGITSSTSDLNLSDNVRIASFNVIGELIPMTEVKAISISPEASNVLALRRGTVWSWGINGAGAVGDGTTINRSIPVQVDGLMSIQSISAGHQYALALKSDGTVWAWGTNERGTLGNGSEISISTRPVRVIGLSSVVAISAGSSHERRLCGS